MKEIYGNYEQDENIFNYIKNCMFMNNTSQNGGSIYLYFPGNLIISDCSFLYNEAKLGSGIYYEQKSKIISK